MLKELGIVQYGWLEQGATFNSLSPMNRWNGPVSTNDRSNEYEMNQLWLGWERPVKTDGCGWDIGGRIDLMYGSDWRYGECYGLETNLDAPNHLYGFILPQFYMEVGYNDLTVKMGHFAPSIGYEVVAAPGNFFYSHSYALGYSEPVLVTGLQADYKLSNHWNVIGGFNNGFNEFEDQNGMLHFLGGAKWHNDEHKVSLSLMTDIGPQMIRRDRTTSTYIPWSSRSNSTKSCPTPSSRSWAARRRIPTRPVRPIRQVVRLGPVPDLHDQSVLVGGRPRGVFPRPGRDAGRRLGQRGYRRLAGRPGVRGHVHGGHAGAELASQSQHRHPARGPLGLL